MYIGACTMFSPRAGIRNVKNFVSLSCERFSYFDASGVADAFSGLNFNEAEQILATFD